MKKLLALVLAVAMLLSLSVVAFADTKYSDDLYDGNGNKAPDPLIPGTSYYYVIGPSSQYDSLLDTSLIRFSLKKKEGGKYIDTAELVEKKFTKEFDGHPAGRYVAIQITPKDNYSAEEYKSALLAEFKAKKDLVATNIDKVISNGAFPVFREAKANEIIESDPDDLANAKKNYEDAVTEEARLKGLDDAQATVVSDKLAAMNATANPDDENASNHNLYTEMKEAEEALESANAAKDILDPLVTKAETLDGMLSEKDNLVTRKDLLDAVSNALSKYEGISPTPSADDLSALNSAIQNYNNNSYGRDITLPVATEPTVNGGDISNLNTIQTDNSRENTDLQGRQAALADDNISDAKADISETSLSDGTVGSPESGTWKDYINGKITALDINGKKAALEVYTNSSNTGTYDVAKKAYTDAKDAYDDAVKARFGNGTSEATADGGTYKDYKDAQADTATKKTAYENAKKGEAGVGFLKAGDTIETSFKIYIQNENIKGEEDGYFTIGEKGKVIKPVANEWNTVTWEDANRTLAYMEFYADSDTSYFYPKLSSKWNNEDYESYFDGMDAYMFNFVDNPTISATSRPSLYLYNPFVDEDGELYVDLDDLYVYQVVDGELKDVTSTVTFKENDDGDEVILIKTRTLGTYIVSEGEANIPEDEIPDDDDPIIIDNNNKVIPNTGR